MLEIAEFLIRNGIEVNAETNRKLTALHVASIMGYKDIGELLIEHGADIEAQYEDGETPLHQAGSKAIAELLINKGADINAKSNNGRTPLVAAIYKEREDIADLLRSYGAKDH